MATSPASPTASTGAAIPTADTGPDEPLAPTVDQAFDCDISSVSERPGTDLHRRWLAGAVCNDGTQAAMYLRAAADPEETRWVVLLEGGSRCASGETCRDRWCGVDYDATKMSSRWLQEQRSEDGLMRLSEDNPFGGWNQVFLPYCSSDMWTGTQRDVVLQADGQDFRVHFDGATTFALALAELQQGVGSDDGLATLPPIGGASTVVLAGLSAGAAGVVHHLDGFAAALPGVEVRGVIDAMFTPAPEGVDVALVDAYGAEVERQWVEEFHALYGAQVDESCAAAEGDAPWNCIDPRRVEELHIQTPYLLVHDLADGPLSAPYLALGATREGYLAGSWASLTALAAARPDVAVHGSVCRHHTRIGANRWFDAQAVFDGLRPWTVEEALSAWLDGQSVVVIDDVDGSRSWCPGGP